MTIKRRNYGRTGHGYTVDDIKFPGVTTILSLVAKPALTDWAARTAAAYAIDNWDQLSAQKTSERARLIQRAPWAELDAAARKGTEVHRIAERIVNLADGDDARLAAIWATVPEPLRGHVESYLQFLDDHDPEPMAVELVVVNRAVRYCGTADLIAHMDGERWLLDIKTGRSGIFPEAALQQCAYMHAEAFTLFGEDGAETPMADLGVQRAGAIHVRSDGYDLIPLETGPEVWEYFQRLAWMHERAETMRGWVGEVLAPPLRVVS